MAETANSTSGGDQGAREEQLSIQQPAGDVEMADLSSTQPKPANPDTTTSPGDDAEPTPIPVPDKDPPAGETSSKAQGKAPATEEDNDLTIDPVDEPAGLSGGPSGGADLAVEIMLLLTTGARHPFRIDEKYLTKRNVTVTGKTEDGRMDPFSITVYKLKELILRDWRKEWDDPPREPTSIRLIHFGKLLEDRNLLSHYHFNPQAKNVIHMTVKPQDLIDEEEAAKKVKDSSSGSGRSGCCVIL
ncbi:ubiquitin-related domain-containing protein [Biscogniauxia mediterranea]|nr:ubiquitin-related domain-containing protein [Biscogniauxia mediterranea]